MILLYCYYDSSKQVRCLFIDPELLYGMIFPIYWYQFNVDQIHRYHVKSYLWIKIRIHTTKYVCIMVLHYITCFVHRPVVNVTNWYFGEILWSTDLSVKTVHWVLLLLCEWRVLCICFNKQLCNFCFVGSLSHWWRWELNELVHSNVLQISEYKLVRWLLCVEIIHLS